MQEHHASAQQEHARARARATSAAAGLAGEQHKRALAAAHDQVQRYESAVQQFEVRLFLQIVPAWPQT